MNPATNKADLTSWRLRAWIAGLALVIPFAVLADSDADDRINLRGTVDDDYYAAGGIIDIDADIDGDVIVAGGELLIGNRVRGDVIAAGGTLRIRGLVDDDVRVTGGELDIDARIGDDLAASGGSIELATTTTVGGDVWLAGGEVHVAGTVNGDLRIVGGEVKLSGTVLGDVDLEAWDIQILDSARIEGDLKYRSPQPAVTAARVEIGGEIDYEAGEPKYGDRGFGLFFSITLVVASIIFYLLFPFYTVASVQRIAVDPLVSLGLGFLFLVGTPMIAFFLMLIVLGLWVGLSVLALYCVALLSGLLIACFFVADRGAKLFKQDISSRARRLISVIVAIFVLGLVQTIPLLGGLILFILLLLGLGAGLVQLRYVYRVPSTG
ncbi:MAG: polymer-forming cytoskeletal protein [Gammaproteobacteria bacterium]|nr:polymer-forming cytoskeletal protein [Gammaproteobacteria bacterium]